MKKRVAQIVMMGAALGLAVYAHAAVKETVLYKFLKNGGGAYAPLSNLVMDKAGNLYGTASLGGPNNAGAVFELSPTSGGWTYSVLHTFTLADGNGPYGPLTMDSAGNLYGVTSQGGSSGSGVVFELSPDGSGGWTETTVYNAMPPTSPSSSVVVGSVGNLYGAVSSGFGSTGSIFELSPSDRGWIFQVIFDFSGANGANPVSLALDGAGNLYGMTDAGGSSTNCKDGCGVVFELTKSGETWSEQVLLNFDNANGAGPGSITLDNSGNLFGAAGNGGPKGHGVVFELSQNAGVWTQTILHAFSDTNGDGSYPYMPLLLVNGAVYGTTLGGGSGTSCSGGFGEGCGTAFRLSLSGTTWKENILHSFTAQYDGGFPYGIATDGTNLYGVTQVGGGIDLNNQGVVYRLSEQ